MGWSETQKKKKRKTGLTLLNSDFTVALTNLIPQVLLTSYKICQKSYHQIIAEQGLKLRFLDTS